MRSCEIRGNAALGGSDKGGSKLNGYQASGPAEGGEVEMNSGPSGPPCCIANPFLQDMSGASH